jgi:aspartyl-tRNA(Asn)/glutamyl-tRNA(Gln) amidotransferase subunit C
MNHMSKLSLDEIQNIAALARLTFSNDEIMAFSTDLANVLTMIEQISEVDTTNIEPMSHPLNLTQRLREDVVETTDSASLQITQKNAPEMLDNLYLVPKVIENIE